MGSGHSQPIVWEAKVAVSAICRYVRPLIGEADPFFRADRERHQAQIRWPSPEHDTVRTPIGATSIAGRARRTQVDDECNSQGHGRLLAEEPHGRTQES